MKTYVLKVEPFTKFAEPKAQALKPLEEAAEVFGAWQASGIDGAGSITPETLDGIVRAGRKATGDAHLDASCISPAWRPGWHPLSNPYVRKALGIEG